MGLFDPSGTADNASSSNLTADTYFIAMPGSTAAAAFCCIARLLSLACHQESGFNIMAPLGTIPASISPTEQQQVIPHKPYIDMLPWPSLRDRLLKSTGAINENEFIADMTSSELRVWGTTPWDPMSWEVSDGFANKWWFLMDEGIVRVSNFWRSQRGEPRLLVSTCLE